jgi:hypothetical protein
MVFAPDECTNDCDWDQLFSQVLDATMEEPPVNTTLHTADAPFSGIDALQFDNIPDLYPPTKEALYSRNSGHSTGGSFDSLTLNFAGTNPFSSTPQSTDHRDDAGGQKPDKPPCTTIYQPTPVAGSLKS